MGRNTYSGHTKENENQLDQTVVAESSKTRLPQKTHEYEGKQLQDH